MSKAEGMGRLRRERRERVMLAGGGEREKRRLRGWEVFSLSIPVVHTSLLFSLTPPPPFCVSFSAIERND